MHGWCEKDPLDPTEQTLHFVAIKEHSTEMHQNAHLMHLLSILMMHYPYQNSHMMIEYTKISHSKLLHTKSTKDPTRSQEQTYKNLGHRKRPLIVTLSILSLYFSTHMYYAVQQGSLRTPPPPIWFKHRD